VSARRDLDLGPDGAAGDPARMARLLARQAAREARPAFRNVFGGR
jgi:hypothetical protein